MAAQVTKMRHADETDRPAKRARMDTETEAGPSSTSATAHSADSPRRIEDTSRIVSEDEDDSDGTMSNQPEPPRASDMYLDTVWRHHPFLVLVSLSKID